jgi:putative endonuclease
MAKPFWMYILQCADGSFYTGHTDDLEQRLWQHDEAMFPDCYTVEKRPLVLFYAEECQTREDAKRREYQVKSWSRAKKIALARQDWATLSYFAKPPRGDHPWPFRPPSSMNCAFAFPSRRSLAAR